MIPWTLLDTARLPGGGELRLKRRGGEFSIMLGSNELMNSRLSGSEEALATLSCARLAERPQPRMLIGGLGMGFTLRAALAALPASARVEVAELVPQVADWARGPMAEVFAGSLDDRRVALVIGDVSAVMRAGAGFYDAILLDVDNGPDGLTIPANDQLYGEAGLAAARAALQPGGVLAVWSQGPDRGFTQRLRRAGFAVEEKPVRAGRGRGARHMIWLAVSPVTVPPAGSRRTPSAA
ncbi:hypothetical protein ASG72_17480 [Bosea sp. Leaf344]|uniref:hypothetical protein n=1 Tax=Bosea sp. Leaf344 TaxID=1736346 RepID=UPI0006F3F25C|nr:hypothetical protein [Bosea sp. Leaf344]KQU50402.1 hypothetical protein ASG72_17480 [Bosea sp. Leaf344]